MLDNVDHVKAYWIQIGEKLAQVALHFGADDLVGTVIDETITHAAGATTASGLTRAGWSASSATPAASPSSATRSTGGSCGGTARGAGPGARLT